MSEKCHTCPNPPELICEIKLGMDIGLSYAHSFGNSTPPPTPPVEGLGGMLGQHGLGFFVLGAPEGF